MACGDSEPPDNNSAATSGASGEGGGDADADDMQSSGGPGGQTTGSPEDGSTSSEGGDGATSEEDGGASSDSGGQDVSGSEISDCENPTVHEANPGNFSSVIAMVGNGCHEIIMDPGEYIGGDLPELGYVMLRCLEPHECTVNGWHIGRYDTLIIEGMRFHAYDGQENNNYGLALYNGNGAKLQNNIWDTATTVNQTHGVSIKNTAARIEILENSFDCLRHCIEISQNGNIRTRNSLTGSILIAGNTFSSLNTVITNRNSCEVVIDDNDFVSVGSTAITNLPFWSLYPYGAADDDGELYVPKCPYPQDQATGEITMLSTRVTNNRIEEGNLNFNGRGVVEDMVFLEGNTGPYSCGLSSMGGDAQEATIDEQTADPPQLAAGSDPC